MAKDRNQSEEAPVSRVYRASDVHKRSAKDKSRPSPTANTVPLYDVGTIPSGSERDEEPETKPDAPPKKRRFFLRAHAKASEPVSRAATDAADDDSSAADSSESAPVDAGDGESSSDAQASQEAAGDTAEETGETANDATGDTAEPADGAHPEPVGPGEPGESGEPDDAAAAKRKLTGKRIAIIAVSAVALVLLALVGAFAAQRWALHDDRAHIVGTWRIDGSEAFVTITENEIELNSETVYTYDIDPAAKTMTYRFGELQGQGRYWFSADYGTLVIIDGDDYTVWGTAVEDAAHAITHLFDDEPLTGEGAITLRK